MEGIILEEAVTGAIATAAQPGSEEEQKLAEEISRLWEVRVQTKDVVQKNKEELKTIREQLGERLFQMKQLLARPGRNEQWSAWLKERHISRATADRLVQRFAATLPGHESPHDAIPEPATPTAEKLAATVWSSSLRKVLVTGESVFQFLASIAQISGIPHEQRQEGLMIFNPVPVPKAADEVPASAPAADPAPQLAHEASAAPEEPGAETAATPMAVGVVAAAVDAVAGIAA
jgi:hypothetical protein